MDPDDRRREQQTVLQPGKGVETEIGGDQKPDASAAPEQDQRHKKCKRQEGAEEKPAIEQHRRSSSEKSAQERAERVGRGMAAVGPGIIRHELGCRQTRLSGPFAECRQLPAERSGVRTPVLFYLRNERRMDGRFIDDDTSAGLTEAAQAIHVGPEMVLVV